MSVFDILTLFGGLALFLYGMRLMGDGLKESSSGTLKVAMEHVTNNAWKAFLLGLGVTALIQSSTATIVITAGLVGAGIITLKQSLGIIVGANVGTTVTGQIIRLLDIDSGSAAWLQVFRPSTLAPIALIAGIIIIMGLKFRNSRSIGNIVIGFGILFTGLITMTDAVDVLAESGALGNFLVSFGNNPLLGFLTGTAVSFVLQSSSAAVGILQAFAASGKLTFSAIYAVIVGIYLGDCTTTAIVVWIGAKAEPRRVAVVNLLFNFGKMALVFIGVTVLKSMGVLNGIWDAAVTSGSIANTNTIFNLISALLLFPLLTVMEKTACRIVKDDEADSETFKYKEQIEALNPVFIDTPALALRSCYELLLTMFYAARKNIERAFALQVEYDEVVVNKIREEEDNIDTMTDKLCNYLQLLSSGLTEDLHIQILDQYYKVVTEFERLGDYAMNIAELSEELNRRNVSYSNQALAELSILNDLISRILDLTEETFKHRDADAAYQIEPLEEVVDNFVAELRERHLDRLYRGQCNVYAGSAFMDLLGDIERISDMCSDVGLATVARVHPELNLQPHDYIALLHAGEDETFNRYYQAAYQEYFGRLNALEYPAN
ncbi:MAG: Na/Pi cotransporter family protein [Solobacterium sp.]|nr:Na/Pi cotransporter family protein [Solobacterium sp.]